MHKSIWVFCFKTESTNGVFFFVRPFFKPFISSGAPVIRPHDILTVGAMLQTKASERF